MLVEAGRLRNCGFPFSWKSGDALNNYALFCMAGRPRSVITFIKATLVFFGDRGLMQTERSARTNRQETGRPRQRGPRSASLALNAGGGGGVEGARQQPHRSDKTHDPPRKSTLSRQAEALSHASPGARSHRSKTDGSSLTPSRRSLTPTRTVWGSGQQVENQLDAKPLLHKCKLGAGAL